MSNKCFQPPKNVLWWSSAVKQNLFWFAAFHGILIFELAKNKWTC